MSNNYKVIDETKWKRSVHCQVFRNCIEPMFCITFELDITNFLKKIRKKDLSFTLSFIYVVSKCANEIEEFRYRFVDGKVVLFDKIDTAFVYLDKQTELFKAVNAEMKDTLEEYVKGAVNAVEDQTDYFTGPMGNDVFQFSCIPWITYTHVSHTNFGTKDNATPLFDWGKYYRKDKKMMMPFTVQAHHSFVDGIHVGRLAKSLQDYLNNF